MNVVIKRKAGRLLAVLAISLTAAASATTFTATTSQAQALVYPYGAFAYSPAQHSVVEAGWGPDPVSAEVFAVAQCRQRANDCLPVGWFRNAYASFVVGAGTGGDQVWGWGTW